MGRLNEQIMKSKQEALDAHPELEYIRQWSEDINSRQYADALATLNAGLKLAKERKSRLFVKHFLELRRITAIYLARAPSDRESKNPDLLGKEEARIPCSFCGKERGDVSMMVAGANGFICDRCIKLCSDIVARNPATSAKKKIKA